MYDGHMYLRWSLDCLFVGFVSCVFACLFPFVCMCLQLFAFCLVLCLFALVCLLDCFCVI